MVVLSDVRKSGIPGYSLPCKLKTNYIGPIKVYILKKCKLN